MPMKKNEPPHSTDSTASSDQSLASIRWSLDVICGSAIQDRADAYGIGRNAGHPNSRNNVAPAQVPALRRRAAEQPYSARTSYLRKQRPTVGDVAHFAPSAAPPPGQNTDTRVSLASQLAAPSPCTALRPAGAASPLSPLSPLAPGALRPLRSLRTLCALRARLSHRTLRARLSLGAGDALNALRARQTVLPLRAPLAFRPRIPAASGKRKRNSNEQNGNDFHDGPPRIDWLQSAARRY